MADTGGKRYYWLKLQDDFFKSKRIKKLRRIAGGDTYTIIYLKMQLLAMKKGGVLEYTGLEQTFADELALDLDEEPENVSVTVSFLLSCGLLETSDNREYFVPYAVLNTGSEGASAKRVREHRERKALQCNTDVTDEKQICNGEKEIEIEIESEKKKELKIQPSPAAVDAFFDSVWKLYPVKKGKGQVSKSKRLALYKIGFDELSRAIGRYTKDLQKDAAWRKPQNGSTFFNSGYVDYLDENYSPDERTESNGSNQSSVGEAQRIGHYI